VPATFGHYGLDQTWFKEIDLLYSIQNKVDGHLTETFRSKQTTMQQFFRAVGESTVFSVYLTLIFAASVVKSAAY